MAALTLERSRCNARVSSVLINLGMVFHSDTTHESWHAIVQGLHG